MVQRHRPVAGFSERPEDGRRLPGVRTPICVLAEPCLQVRQRNQRIGAISRNGTGLVDRAAVGFERAGRVASLLQTCAFAQGLLGLVPGARRSGRGTLTVNADLERHHGQDDEAGQQVAHCQNRTMRTFGGFSFRRGPPASLIQWADIIRPDGLFGALGRSARRRMQTPRRRAAKSRSRRAVLEALRTRGPMVLSNDWRP